MNRQAQNNTRKHMLPSGYSLLREYDGNKTAYSFSRKEGSDHGMWYSWELRAVDAMWRDVRDRATRAMRPDKLKEAEEKKRSLSYGMGYADSAAHQMADIEQALARGGYVLHMKEPRAVVEHLLQLLDGR